jgi:hypothetical protein
MLETLGALAFVTLITFIDRERERERERVLGYFVSIRMSLGPSQV